MSNSLQQNKIVCFVPWGDVEKHRLALEFKQKAKEAGQIVEVRQGEPGPVTRPPGIH